MRYIIQMTLSGSIICLLYLGANYCLGERFSNRTKYFMIKAAVLFYLIPLIAVDRYLVTHVDIVRKVFMDNGKIILLGRGANVLYHTGKGLVLSKKLWIQLLIAVVWGVAVLGILTYECIWNLRWIKWLSRQAHTPKIVDTEITLNEMKKKYGVRRRIKVCRNRECDKQAFSLGSIQPVIFCFGKMCKEEEALVYAHEVVHIKRGDFFWKILTECAWLIHCFNPFLWWLRKELEYVCEKTCDDEVLKDKGTLEREQYAVLLIEFAKGEPIRGGWSVALSKKNKLLKERVENVMHEKTNRRLGQFISFGIVMVVVMFNSLTALAYGMVPEVSFESERLANKDDWGDTEAYFIEDSITTQDFIESGYEDWIWEYDILYDFQFVDERGNIYSVSPQDTEVYVVCQHQYVSGIYKKHVKDSNGGCTTTLYSASRCSLCGNVVVGEELGTNYLKVCTH